MDGMTNVEMLGEINKAITKVLMGGQSYRIGSREVTRADLGMLRKLKTDLELQMASSNSGSLFDNTVIGIFEGR